MLRCTLCGVAADGYPPRWTQMTLVGDGQTKYVVACPDESTDAVAKVVRDKLTDMRGVIQLPKPPAVKPTKRKAR